MNVAKVCQRGHKMIKANVYVSTDGYPRCRLCLNAAKLRYLNRNREQVRAYNREFQREWRRKQAGEQ